jgi:hypothetical protein
MEEYRQSQTLLFLKKMFPEFESNLEYIYRQNTEFREIAEELFICVHKQEKIFKETGKMSISFMDTINELKEELLAYLNNLNASDRITDKNN